MISHEHKRDQNQSRAKKRSIGARVLRLTALLLTLGVLTYAGLVAYVCYREATVPAPGGYNAIIVLGAQVLPDGEPSVQLRWRLDKALEMYRLNPCVVVVCGARGGMEPRPEADVMRELMIADGVPEAMIYADPDSMDTRQNMNNAKKILDSLGLAKPLVVTSDYHLPRAMEIAADAGFTPQGAGSLCRPELTFWAQNHGREALAWVKYWLVKYVGLKL